MRLRLTELSGLLLSNPGVAVHVAVVGVALQIHRLPVLADDAELAVLILVFYSGKAPENWLKF